MKGIRRLLLWGGILLSFVTMFSSCGREQATITVQDIYREDMLYIPEEEQEPDPEPVVYKVSAGDEIGNIRIVSVGRKRIRIQMDTEYYSYGKARKNYVLRRGETLSISEYGLLDATHSIKITFPDAPIPESGGTT